MELLGSPSQLEVIHRSLDISEVRLILQLKESARKESLVMKDNVDKLATQIQTMARDVENLNAEVEKRDVLNQRLFQIIELLNSSLEEMEANQTKKRSDTVHSDEQTFDEDDQEVELQDSDWRIVEPVEVTKKDETETLEKDKDTVEDRDDVQYKQEEVFVADLNIVKQEVEESLFEESIAMDTSLPILASGAKGRGDKRKRWRCSLPPHITSSQAVAINNGRKECMTKKKKCYDETCEPCQKPNCKQCKACKQNNRCLERYCERYESTRPHPSAMCRDCYSWFAHIGNLNRHLRNKACPYRMDLPEGESLTGLCGNERCDFKSSLEGIKKHKKSSGHDDMMSILCLQCNMPHTAKRYTRHRSRCGVTPIRKQKTGGQKDKGRFEVGGDLSEIQQESIPPDLNNFVKQEADDSFFEESMVMDSSLPITATLEDQEHKKSPSKKKSSSMKLLKCDDPTCQQCLKPSCRQCRNCYYNSRCQERYCERYESLRKPVTIMCPECYTWFAQSSNLVRHRKKTCPFRMGMKEKESLEVLCGNEGCDFQSDLEGIAKHKKESWHEDMILLWCDKCTLFISGKRFSAHRNRCGVTQPKKRKQKTDDDQQLEEQS